MTRPRTSTVVRRFIEGDDMGDISAWLYSLGMDSITIRTYIEHCIRRALNDEVRVTKRRRKR